MSCRYAVGNDRCQYESYTQSIYRRYAISDEASLRESAAKLDRLHQDALPWFDA